MTQSLRPAPRLHLSTEAPVRMPSAVGFSSLFFALQLGSISKVSVRCLPVACAYMLLLLGRRTWDICTQ